MPQAEIGWEPLTFVLLFEGETKTKEKIFIYFRKKYVLTNNLNGTHFCIKKLRKFLHYFNNPKVE